MKFGPEGRTLGVVHGVEIPKSLLDSLPDNAQEYHGQSPELRPHSRFYTAGTPQAGWKLVEKKPPPVPAPAQGGWVWITIILLLVIIVVLLLGLWLTSH